MSKFRIQNSGSTLDPFADFKTASQALGVTPQRNIDPYQGMGTPNIAETFSGANLDEGFSLLGNSNLALDTQRQTKYEDQGIRELLAKGVGRTLGKIGTEVLKMPGYAGGAVMALGNETLGDGKNSMALAVDNAWLKAFSSLDQSIKDSMPITISKEIEEGSIWNKAASGSWWATQGADGAGFMLSMFVPGALTKVLGVGKGIAGLTEVLANTRLGKGVRVAGDLLKGSDEIAGMSSLANQPYQIGKAFARNADGVTSALMNTTLESMAEAADTYQQAYTGLREKVRNGEISDDKAKELAGSQASNVFKSNLALLMLTNLADQAFIWKAFGAGGTDSIIKQVVKEGKIDFDALSKLGNKGYLELASGATKAFGLNALKEAGEEGVQTIAQQNAAKGREGTINAITDLASQLGGAFTGDNTFWNNKELHESMFLGGILGGGMGLVGSIKDNNDLKRQLNGYDIATTNITPVQRMAQKLGFKRETKDQKGLKSLIQDSWLKNFKGDLNSLKDAEGNLDNQKVSQAFESGNKELALHALYDAAVAAGDNISATKFSTFLAQHYVQPFLGQAGMDKVFQSHVENQVTPAWQERFEANNGRPATTEEVNQFKTDFTESGQRVFRAYEESERTNYPERYYKGEGDNQSYAKFRQRYFQGKFETLLELDSLNLEKTKLNKDLQDSGLYGKVIIQDGKYHVNEGTELTPQESQKLSDYSSKSKQIANEEKRLGDVYNQFFTKEGVKSIYDLSNQLDKALEEVQTDVNKENEGLVQENQSVDQEATIKAAELETALDNPEGTAEVKNKKTGKKAKVKKTLEGPVIQPTQSGFTEVNNFSIQKGVELYKKNSSEDEYFTGEKFGLVGTISAWKASGETLQSLLVTTPSGNKTWLNKGEWWDYYTKTEPARPLEKKDLIQNDIVDPNSPDADIISEEQNRLEDFQPVPGTEVELTEPSELPVVQIEPERLRDSEIETEFVELGKLSVTDRITTGRHIQYGPKFEDLLTPEGLPVLGTIEQQRWQKALDNIDNPLAYQTQVMSIGQIKENPVIYEQVLRSNVEAVNLNDSDLWVFLNKNQNPVMDGENYTFTSLYTPDVMYKDIQSTRVASKYIEQLYANHLGQEIPESVTELRKFRQDAFDYAKAEYTKWYNNLRQQAPVMLQVNEVTKGHMLVRKDPQTRETLWNKANGNIPGVTVKKGKLVGGELEISTSGEINSGGRLLKVNKGDVVITTKDGIYPMRNRNLNESEINTVIELIKQVSPAVSLNNLRLEGEFPISQFETETSLGIFYEQNKSPLIRYLMNWGGTGEGSINIGQGNLTVDFIPFGGEFTLRLPIADLNNKSSQAYQQLRSFLETKRYNVTKELLNTGTAFAKPVVNKGQVIMEKQKKTYEEYLFNDVLQTISVVNPDYTSRLQRNLVLGEPISKVDMPQETKVEEPKRTTRAERIAAAEGLNLDRIFTVDELIQQKIISGEIKKYCK